jgi:hypothetical protein
MPEPVTIGWLVARHGDAPDYEFALRIWSQGKIVPEAESEIAKEFLEFNETENFVNCALAGFYCMVGGLITNMRFISLPEPNTGLHYEKQWVQNNHVAIAQASLVIAGTVSNSFRGEDEEG